MTVGKEVQLELLALRPNNWFISREKLDRVREAWDRGLQDNLPPVLVTCIEGQASLIDGHSRAYAAFEKGATKILALVEDLKDIEGSSELYLHIHEEGPSQGIECIADLTERILDPEEYREKWIGYCSNWLKENYITNDTDI